MEHGAGHRLGVNVVTADRVANTVVPEEKVRRSAPELLIVYLTYHF